MAPKTIPNRFGLVGGSEAFELKKENRYYGGEAKVGTFRRTGLAKLPTWRPGTASGSASPRWSGAQNERENRRPFSARTRIHSTGASNRKEVVEKEAIAKKSVRPMSASVVARPKTSGPTSRPSTSRPRDQSAEIRVLSQKSKSDRLLSDSIRLKINSLGPQMSQIRQYLWDLDQNKNGKITYGELEECLTRFSFGLKKNQMMRVARTLDVDCSGMVKYVDLFNFFDNDHPLGLSDIDQAEDNIVHAAPWHKVRGKYKGNPADRKDISVPHWVSQGLQQSGTHEERSSLRFLTNILKDKFMQLDSKLKKIFSKYDMNRNGKISRGEYIQGLHSLHLGIPDAYFNKLFDEVDADGSGEIDYEEFVSSFDEGNWFDMKPQEETRRKRQGTESAATSPQRGQVEEDEKEWQNPPLPRSILLLTEKLRATPNTGVELFRKYDKNGDGYISKGELIEGLTRFAPDLCTIGEIQEMLTRFDKNKDNYFSYDEFAEYLQSSTDELHEHHAKSRLRRKERVEEKQKLAREKPPVQRYIGSDPNQKFGRFASRPDHANTFKLIIPPSGFPGHLSTSKLYGESRNKWILDMQDGDREEKRLNQQYKLKTKKKWNTLHADRVAKTDLQVKGRDKANIDSIARQHRRFMERARLYEFMNEEIQDSSACLFTKNVF
ncbi:EF-hand domain-containing protein [Chloropicon primus]|uniref:EF-hand domain-containing protein n=1 Tax=Chloropicon primus TaxID=1764295 RepID=A0A5B8MMI2_9CHLO|nr:hypothetical protein A3770_04p30280 [Chloropicon primus]UPQ99720.1 EF-hand domain-containing protein [Chloropicon primus]|eukprot:QDZ20510.1 hypothetical protein A3770_04p30280 [Chloropicon primus]